MTYIFFVKDPRNLLICFECINLMCHELRMGPFVDETFETFACYFPIDFTPVKFKFISISLNFLYLIVDSVPSLRMNPLRKQKKCLL